MDTRQQGDPKPVSARGEPAALPDAVFRAMFEQLTAAALLVDPASATIVSANEAASHYFGIPLQDFQGRAIGEFLAVSPEELGRAGAEAREGRCGAYQWGSLVPGGQGRPTTVLVSSVPFGPRGLVLAIVYDCPDRVRMGQALQRSEERFRLLVETTADVIWTIDEDLRFTYVSPAIVQLRGLTPEEATRESILDAVCPESHAAVLEVLRPPKTPLPDPGQVTPAHIELEQPRKDGSRVWVEMTVRMLYDEQGTWRGALGISRDITRRKAIETALAEYRDRLERQNQELQKLWVAIEQSGSTIVMTDAHGTILYVNPRFEETSGYSRDEALGQNPRMLKSGVMGQEHYRHLWETISSGRVWRGEFLNRRKDGSLYWETATIAPVVDDSGRITNYIAIKEDITARKEAEESLLTYASQLERHNAELDAFAHTVAHDLKGPLGALVGFSELLVDAPTMDEKERASLLAQINQIGWQMNRIVDALLLLSATHRKKVDITPLDMGSIVATVKERLAPMIEEYDAILAEPEEWPTALGFAPWVEEVWVNYLSNALKYGGRPPRVELGAERTGRGQVRFWVRDNGIGLSEEEQARLFAPFTRLRQVSVEGHGLGLSIVRRLVERLGGSVGVESTVGKGSVFSFTLPEAPPSEESTPPPAPSGSSPAA